MESSVQKWYLPMLLVHLPLSVVLLSWDVTFLLMQIFEHKFISHLPL